MAVRLGDRAARKFVIDEASMRWFQEVAQDTSRIHCDRSYAQSRGYADVLAYGGILIAHLSHLLGMQIPGSNGTSTAWSIKFHEPLYLGEEAEITLEVSYVSAATGIVEGKFNVMAGEKRCATGTTQSLLPLQDME
jgi:3-hydroxybutyryl-CoA dehydratase